MITITRNIEIHRPLADVYRFASRLEYIPLWVSGVVSVDVPKTIQAGTTGTVSSLGFGRESKNTFTVIDCEPNKLLKFESTSGPLEFTITFRFEEVNAETTRFYWNSQVKVGSFFALATPLIRELAEGRSENDLLALKLLLESDEATELLK